MNTPKVAPVLIVGAGPVGSTLALELAVHDVRCILIDRLTGPSPHPKMDFLNGRSMELLRRLDITDEIRSRGVAPEYSANFLWNRTFAEDPVTVWEHPSVVGTRERIGKVNDGSAPLEAYQRLQGSLLEDILRRRARDNPLIDVREGCTVEDVVQDAQGVHAKVVESGTTSVGQVSARYAVGCDGASSTVRRGVGIPVRTVGPVSQNCDVYFRSSDPELRRHGRFFLAIVANGLTLVCRDEKDTWTGTFSLPEGGEVAQDPMGVVKERLGIDFAVSEVLNVACWEGRLSVADSYRSGAVFLAGDSAHQFYPTGGHGANTGLADAVDLGWKLAAVMNGWGGVGLLKSYEIERRPVALFNREMCLNLLEVWGRFSNLVGSGCSREQLEGFLEQEAYQIDNVGIHFDYRYPDSPIVWGEAGAPPRWHWNKITPSTFPGSRVPSMHLADGSALFDYLGTDLTLVDLSEDCTGKSSAVRAQEVGIPLTYLAIGDTGVRAAWGCDLVLVRPDQHVAWRGNAPPVAWDAVLDCVRGSAVGQERYALQEGVGR